ncbi:hypothetical protein [Rhodanobacter sp. DHG33]|uniref:hypothetical protein n=1 Tax=Rhodanobacter sp. DHG33 TaxID=2775921 RepID=UPI00177C58DC|nr:hypothetical protein [Rhodanobacter sp. DHG33]MBD8899005.1 hypothetical protein [Rhodanobacter sp. DHG33]
MATDKEGEDAGAAVHYDVADSPTLTFAALNAKIDALPQFPETPTILPINPKWGFIAAATGALVGLLSVKLLPSNAIYTFILASIGILVEIVGVVVAILSDLPKKWPTFARQRREFAEQLDFDLPHHMELVTWLRTFPVDQRKTLGEFVTYRHARMKEKLPLFTGSIEKLGALPVLIALYLQFKDMHWPPHPSWIEIVLIFALVYGYYSSVRLISERLRLQLYETLLSKALT